MTSKQAKQQIALLDEIRKSKLKEDYNAYSVHTKKIKSLWKPPTLEYLLKAEQAIENNQLEEAEKQLQIFTKEVPQQPDTPNEKQSFQIFNYMFARVHFLKKDAKMCLLYLENINPIDENELGGVNLKLVWPCFDLEQMGMKASCLYDTGEKEKAMKQYQEFFDKVISKIKELESCDVRTLFRIQSLMINLAKLHEEKGELKEAVNIYRKFFTNPIPLVTKIKYQILRELGRILVRRMGNTQYEPLQVPDSKDLFIPKTLAEESLVILNILQNEKYDETVYDDICMLLSENAQYTPLLHFYEQCATNYHEHEESWYQYALALMTAQKYETALGVLQECINTNSKNASYYLLSAKICLNYLENKNKECVEFAKKALELGGLLLSQSHHVLGLAYGNLANEAQSRTERHGYEIKALQSLQRALEIDSHNPLIYYHLALQYAEMREIKKAFKMVKKSLSLNPECVDSWLLLSLLFSCEGDLQNAFSTIQAARTEDPTNIDLLFLAAKLEENDGLQEKTLKTYNKIAEYLKKHSEAWAKIVKPVKNDEIFSVTQPTFQIKLPILSVSALLENTCDYHERQKRKKLSTYYLLLADAYRRLSRFEEATTMVKNAKLQLNDMPSADIHYHIGRIYEDMRRFNEAMNEYEQALIKDANHKHALLRMAILHVGQKNYLSARSYLQSAVRIDPTFTEAWYELGIVLKEMGDLQEAGDCFMASLKYYKTSPIMPFELLLKRRI